MRRGLAGVRRGRRGRPGRCSSPSTSRISRSRMNRLTASQKSSRTITTAWMCSPSHCRKRRDQFGVCSAMSGGEPLLELVEHEQDLLAGPQDSPAGGPRASRPAPARGPDRDTPCAAPKRRESVSFGRRLDIDRSGRDPQPGQQARLDQRRLAAARRAIDQADPEGRVGVGRFDAGLPEPDRSRAGRRDRGGRAAAPGRSRRRARRKTADPWGRP